MIFKELINDLKKIKKPEQIHADVAEHLTSAAIGTYMAAIMHEDEEIDQLEAFEVTRTMILKQLDITLLDIMSHEPMDMGINENSPMNDVDFKASIEKAIGEYNDKLDK